MQSLSIVKPKDRLAEALDEALSIHPTVLFLFAAPSVFRDEAACQLIQARLKGRCAVGCSTAGEISKDGFFMDSVSILAIRFDNVQARSAVVPLPQQTLSFSVGKQLGETLRAPDLRAVFIFGPGTNINGTGLLDGLVASVGTKVFVTGGLAADGLDFKQTFMLCDNQCLADHAVAVGLYGDDLVISNGSEGGWRTFGPARKITKIEGNILLELDGKPALRLYKQYLGEKARDLPASGLSYPFAVLRPDRSTSGTIRSGLAIDAEREAIILAGEIKEGSMVCLMHADTEALTQGAAQAAAESLRTHPGGEENGCALIVSCVGRRYIYGFDVDEEVEVIVDSFLPNTPLAGFYAYGEVFYSALRGQTEFRNQTITIIYMTERKAGA